MDKIREIDQKILDLKSKQDILKKRAGELFYKKAETILGPDFSPELALSILSVSWRNKEEKIREVWDKTADTFRSPRRDDPRKKTPN